MGSADFQPMEMTDYTNTCSKIQEIVNNSDIKKIKNKDYTKNYKSIVFIHLFVKLLPKYKKKKNICLF